MAIPTHIIERFQALTASITRGDCCIVETPGTKADPTKPVYVMCVARYHESDGSTDTYPVALMLDGNPVDYLLPPDGAEHVRGYGDDPDTTDLMPSIDD
jgi:hypothetical protein